LEALLFLGGMVLWGFVFAWHTKYTGLPVIANRVQVKYLWAATFTGLVAATFLGLSVDPQVRRITPEDYPNTFYQWLAMTLFSLGFTQLFMVFAPFAWLLRLFQSKAVAVALTVVFGVVVLLIKNHSSQTPLPFGLLAGMLFVRVASGLLMLYCYLRGGMLLAWWWALLAQSRHLIGLVGDE
jgi:hypothetical protein